MKGKRLIAAVIAVVMLLAIMPVSAFAGKTPSAWAKTEMDDANTAGLLTANAAKDFSRALTRDEFCEIVVIMAEQALGSALPLPVKNPFTDCNSEYVQKAYQFGIVNGRTTTTFDPNASVARQEIAAMMYRAIRGVETRLGRKLSSDPVSSLTFNDKSKIDEYAQEPVRFAVANGIIKGDDINNFNPKNAISAEECVAVAIRSHNSMQTRLDASLTNAQLLDKTMSNLRIGYALGDAQTAVSQDVVLPTRGAGGTVITWTSSNPSIITAAGKIATANGAGVVLTATASLGGATRTASFTLTTTTMFGDQLLVQNAKNALTIGFYNEKDTLDSVTGRIFLPTTVMGLNVTWTSSNYSAVALNGEVVVPTDSSVVTVNMTATFTSGSVPGSKTFTLLLRNPAFAVAGSASLHNVRLGMALADVTKVLGNSKSSLTLATGETWYFYYSDTTFNNFIAIAIQSSKVVGVYTMVSGWETYLRDSSMTRTITVAEANSTTGVKIDTFTDALNANRQYAAFMYDTTSNIASDRALIANAAETFTLLLINAYRYLYGTGTGKTALTNDAILSNSARGHSTDMDGYDYFSPTGRTGSTTYASRAASAGSSAAVLGGVISQNSRNPFNFLNTMISTAADRASILLATAGQVGIGYSGSYTGTYKTLMTLVFASANRITSVTPNITSVSVAAGAYVDVTLTIAPAGFTEAITVTSSAPTIFSVTLQSSPTATTRVYRVQGLVNGSGNISVTGADGRALCAAIPVAVGTMYASSVVIGNTIKSYIAEKTTAATTVQLSAAVTKTTASATAPAATWVSNTAGVTVSATGLVNIPATFSGTSVSITAWAQSSASTTVTNTLAKDTVTIYLVTLNVPAAQSFAIGATAPKLAATQSPATPIGTIAWTVLNNAYADVAADGSINLKSATPTPFTATVRATFTGYNNGTITKNVAVTVTGSSSHASSVTITGSDRAIEVGQTTTIVATTAPTTVAPPNGTITWTSLSPGVATIDSVTGVVKGVSEGTAMIMASVPKEGGGTHASTITITVNPFAPIGIILSKDAIAATVGTAHSETLTYTIRTSWGAVLTSAELTALGITPPTVLWTGVGDATGVSVVDGSVTVDSSATEGTFNISATISGTLFTAGCVVTVAP